MQAPTHQIHHPYIPPAAFEAMAPGVHKASTVFFPSVQAMRERQWMDKSAYTYGLHGTPTTFILEERIATLEGGQYCVLAPSGLAALALVNQAFLSAGDAMLLPDNVYSPSKTLAEGELQRWGISHAFYAPMNPADVAELISPQTRLVWIEAPGSVTLEFPDVRALVQVVAQANETRVSQGLPRIITALDNTWGAGVAFCAFDLGVDVVMQALTKYPSGGADVLMGSVVTRDPALHKALLLTHMRLGLGVGANDAELVLRGLPSMHLRYHAQDQATRQIAQWLQQQPPVAQVFHPALSGSPGHAHWARSASAAACLVSVAFRPEVTSEQVDAFCDRLKLFRIGYSWAGPVSLCVPYNIPAMRTKPWPYAPHVVRLAIGLEAVDDLLADLAQALSALS
jgi:cysteine-S-conjugate beta-lyase